MKKEEDTRKIPRDDLFFESSSFREKASLEEEILQALQMALELGSPTAIRSANRRIYAVTQLDPYKATNILLEIVGQHQVLLGRAIAMEHLKHLMQANPSLRGPIIGTLEEVAKKDVSPEMRGGASYIIKPTNGL